MKKLFIILLLSLTFFVATLSQVANDNIKASSDGSVIKVTWKVATEINVEKYAIERRAGISGAFIRIGTKFPEGRTEYTFEDQTAFKTSANIYEYQVRIIFNNGNAELILGPISVSHSVNSVKRTWGSIKAMFR